MLIVATVLTIILVLVALGLLVKDLLQQWKIKVEDGAEKPWKAEGIVIDLKMMGMAFGLLIVMGVATTLSLMSGTVPFLWLINSFVSLASIAIIVTMLPLPLMVDDWLWDGKRRAWRFIRSMTALSAMALCLVVAVSLISSFSKEQMVSGGPSAEKTTHSAETETTSGSDEETDTRRTTRPTTSTAPSTEPAERVRANGMPITPCATPAPKLPANDQKTIGVPGVAQKCVAGRWVNGQVAGKRYEVLWAASDGNYLYLWVKVSGSQWLIRTVYRSS